jgi:hypothetical protein
MSDPIDDGGPAFPAGTYCNNFGDEVPMRGMSLRDWFAGQALAGMRANPALAKLQPGGAAADAFADADAMLRARKDGES